MSTTTTDPSRLSPIPPTIHSPPSPPILHFEIPPIPPDEPPERHQAEEGAIEDDDDEIPYPEPGSEHTLLPPPSFNSFFTIVEDTTTGEHYHPLVHYVFADDDPAIVTAAAMRSLGLDDTKFLSRPEGAGKIQHLEHEDEGEGQEPAVESPLPPPLLAGKEHYVIIDIAADGHSVVNAQSMSPGWQITNATVRTAPSFDQSSPNQGYMLQIEGIEMPGKSKGKSKGGPGESKLKEAQEKSQGDIFCALDGLIGSVEGGLELAGKISGRVEDVRESEGTVLQTDEAQDLRRRI